MKDVNEDLKYNVIPSITNRDRKSFIVRNKLRSRKYSFVREAVKGAFLKQLRGF